MKMINLNWNSIKEEGTVSLLKDFKMEDSILQIDALNDWIVELTDLRETLLQNEPLVVKNVLWGRD
jgi:hypothetical protein